MFLSNYVSKIKIKKIYIMDYFTCFLRIKIECFDEFLGANKFVRSIMLVTNF